RQYGIDALHADGMDWNRKAGTWIGTETAEQTITFTLA
ncbi:cobalt transporter, partial [Paeniclostridium sordellii]|nr:cobalt transporter [Paeniclostridium sordellii]